MAGYESLERLWIATIMTESLMTMTVVNEKVVTEMVPLFQSPTSRLYRARQAICLSSLKQGRYVSVGELDDVQLFYYFIESEGNPKEDPLMLWLTGGPACSSFSGLYEIGPLIFNTQDFNGNLPRLTLKPYSWTKVASIIFLDAPFGTGFSYANNSKSYVMDDKIFTAQTYEFLRKFFELTQGYVLGNPVTSQHDDANSIVEFAHHVALISDQLYKVNYPPFFYIEAL
ncbi:serine carboxypeptidase-like 18 [Cornus florida]|uniref:serine carboxypeptidase-like 18 n=1 Tax=Cornus florida TaxID=4283 RepID=UPI002897CD75|nr:serine carboxypeptidase-like 18 [Cornus florida]